MNLTDIYNFSRLMLPPFTVIIFLLGLILQLTKWFSIGLPTRTYLTARSSRLKSVIKAWTWDYLPTQYLPLRYEPIFRINGAIFHITLFFIAFTPVHQAFILYFFGVSPNPLFVTSGFTKALFSTLFVTSGSLILIRWIVQYADKTSFIRPIAGKSDFIGISLLILIAVAGILAAHGLADYLLMITVHFISIQLFIIYLPFSKAIHALTGLVTRTYYGFRRAALGV